jgi:hypothetical protein
MRSQRRSFRVGGLAAAAAVLASAALSWGTLCLGEDGHVTLEVSVAGRCIDNLRAAPPAEHGAHLTACERDAGCGPCTDLRGFAGAWLARAASDSPHPPPALSSPTFALAAPLVANAASFDLTQAIAATRHTAAFTTVLRC